MTDLSARKRVFIACLQREVSWGQEDYGENGIQLPVPAGHGSNTRADVSENERGATARRAAAQPVMLFKSVTFFSGRQAGEM
jgi:hypothetical protein